MPAIETRQRPKMYQENVGKRYLPFTQLEYYARSPAKTTKNGVFDCIWLPVNASNRVVVDKQQEVMYMKYAGMIEKLKNIDVKKISYTWLGLSQFFCTANNEKPFVSGVFD